MERNKLNVTSARVTRGEGCLGYPRPYKWGLSLEFKGHEFDIKLQDSYQLNSDWYTDFIYTLYFMDTLVFAYLVIFVCPGMTEPVFKAKEFLTPEEIWKNLIRELSEKKYRNM